MTFSKEIILGDFFQDFFQEKNLIFDLKATNKKTAIQSLIKLLYHNYHFSIKVKELTQIFMQL
jgi:mannitol/fructose-specific phosphotransferase system IIA component (Ntr-type)